MTDTDASMFIVRPKAWMLLAHPDMAALAELRVVFAEWRTQQPGIVDGSDRYTGRPPNEFAYNLNQALEDDDVVGARALIVEADGNPVWRKCARRHMLVAATNGGGWGFGDPAPVYGWGL